MKRSLSIGKEPSLQKIFIASLILHIFFISIVNIPVRTREGEFTGYYVNLVEPVEIQRKRISTPAPKKIKKRVPAKKKVIQKTTKRRVVEKRGVPEKTVTTKAPPRGESAVKETAKLPDPEAREMEIQREIERLQAIHAISKRKEKRAQEIEIIKKRIYETSSMGPVVSEKGTKEISESYYTLITERIWSQWVYPDFGAKGLEVVISIRIDRNGNVISHQIERSSGNTLFDHSAIKAISKASPLPPPPVEMEIGVRFYL